MNTVKIKYGLEDMKSRIPGLFPYLEFDENGVYEEHPASDSNSGCYNKIPCSIKLPSSVNGTIGELKVFEPEGEYSYRTLMNYYYEYVDQEPDWSFIKFMDGCIGKFEIDADIDREECPLVPEYEYYADCARLYDEYMNMSITCQKYLEWKQKDKDNINCEMECLLDKYAKMGGDTMRDYYGEKANAAVEMANTCFGYRGENFNLNFTVNIVSKENDLGVFGTVMNYWDPDRTINEGEIVIYDDRSYLCIVNGVKGAWDDNNFTPLPDYNTMYNTVDGKVDIVGFADSRLTEFRGVSTYVDEGGKMDKPYGSEDWLWYYRIGAVGHYETTNDELGNIQTMGTRNTVNGAIGTNLMAYGDVLTNITRIHDEEENIRTITFEYVVGCNLEAKFLKQETDDDGNITYYYGDYDYNRDDLHGIVYTETYDYEEGGEIDQMSDEEFDMFVSMDRPNAVNSVNGIMGFVYMKAPFSTNSAISTCDMVINGVPQTYTTVLANYNTVVGDVNRDELCSPLTKFDYLTGIAYKPSVKTDVYISRGNAAAWERHIKLSELKTFEDLTTYANGGFFIIR